MTVIIFSSLTLVKVHARCRGGALGLRSRAPNGMGACDEAEGGEAIGCR